MTQQNRKVNIAIWILRICCGLLIVYSAAPWRQAGDAIGKTILSLPLLSLLRDVPLLGMLVNLVFWGLPAVLMLIFWATANIMEVSPIVIARDGGTPDNRARVYACLAYVAEVTVNVWNYAPYGNGWNDFVKDMWIWDAANLQWTQFFLMLGSIGIVEIVVLFMIDALGMDFAWLKFGNVATRKTTTVKSPKPQWAEEPDPFNGQAQWQQETQRNQDAQLEELLKRFN